VSNCNKRRCIYGDLEDLGSAIVEKDAGTWLEVVVPPSPPPNGGTLALPLWDGRAVPVAVPARAVPDTLLRVRVPVQSNTLGVNREAETATAVNALDLNMVPVAVPVVRNEHQAWGHGLSAAMHPVEATPHSAEEAPKPKGPASERYDFDSDGEEDGSGQVFSTGKYNMKMLTRLTQMEGEFRAALAKVWGVHDEDELPDSLQVNVLSLLCLNPSASSLLFYLCICS
jgi:hypothetical protein